MVTLGDPWHPLDELLYTTPMKWILFCDVYISISGNPQKHVQGLAQWTLVTLGRNLMYNNNKINSLLWGLYIYLQLATKILQEITQWALLPLVKNLIYNTNNKNFLFVGFIYQSSVTNLRNCLEVDQWYYDDIWDHKNLHPRNNLPQTCGVRKLVCTVWIRPTDNFLTHPMTSFRIN